jgi:hypothetical protein
MLGEEDQGEPISQGEEVYQEAPGSILVVLIEQIGAAGPETRRRIHGELIQRQNRQPGTRVQVTQRTEE